MVHLNQDPRKIEVKPACSWRIETVAGGQDAVIMAPEETIMMHDGVCVQSLWCLQTPVL